MAKPILILPCKYNLSDFEQKNGSHHCKACDHSLKDFRNSTEDEISNALSETNGKTCGIFHTSQVTHQTTTYQLGLQRRIGLSLLGILGFIAPAILTSCNETPQIPEVKEDLSNGNDAFSKLKFPMIVSGYLRDKSTDEALVMSEVAVCQQKTIIRTTKTDNTGFFRIELQRRDLSSADFDLIVKQLNYKTDTIHQLGTT
jgi:hypothetical protein